MERDTNKQIDRRDRSTSYPSVNLQEAIHLTEMLRKNLGKGPYSREEAAKAIGYSGLSGASARKVAALTQYGLISRSGDTYLLSPLAADILLPVSEERKNAAIAQSAQYPKLFDKLLKKFANQSLPSLLQNILTREGISASASAEVTEIFKDTMKFAGFLKNGVLTAAPSAPVIQQDGGEDSGESGEPAVIKPPLRTDIFTFTDTGSGWTISVQSGKPLNSAIKKALVDVADELEHLNGENQS